MLILEVKPLSISSLVINLILNGILTSYFFYNSCRHMLQPEPAWWKCVLLSSYAFHNVFRDCRYRKYRCLTSSSSTALSIYACIRGLYLLLLLLVDMFKVWYEYYCSQRRTIIFSLYAPHALRFSGSFLYRVSTKIGYSVNIYYYAIFDIITVTL